MPMEAEPGVMGGRGRKPGNAGGPQELEKARNGFSFRASRRNVSLLTLHFRTPEL